MKLRPYDCADEDSVVRLWERCELIRPWNDPRKDIRRKLNVQPELFIVAEADGSVVGTAMAGYEGHRGWVNYVAVAPEYRRRGLGRALMEEVERRLIAMGCPKINLQVRTGNDAALAFYKHLGFSIDATVSMGKRIEVDGPGP